VRSKSRLSSVVCSKHFKPDGLARRLDVQEETSWFKRDEFGITTFPGFVQPLLHLRNSSHISQWSREKQKNGYIFH